MKIHNLNTQKGRNEYVKAMGKSKLNKTALTDWLGYKLFDQQRQEYKTDCNYNDMIYNDLKEVETALYDFHLIDYGDLEEEEFNRLELTEMLDIFGWEVHKITMEITKEDVHKVANDISIGITDEQVRQILELYPAEAKEDKTATWNLIVENLIYNLKN